MATPISNFEPPPRHVASDFDLTPESIADLLDLAAHVKRTPARFAQRLAGRYLALLFEKPSLRTRFKARSGTSTVTPSSGSPGA